MKDKGLLIYKKIGGIRNEFPLSDPTGSSIEHLARIVEYLERLNMKSVF